MGTKATKFHISRTHDIIELWKQFHALYESALSGGKITPQDEQKFMDLKSEIARRFQSLAETTEMKGVADVRSLDVVSRVPALSKIPALSEMERGKIEADWNEGHIALNRVLGSLEAAKDRVRLGLAGPRTFSSFLFNRWMILIYLIVLVIAVYLFLFGSQGGEY
ncbi:MAG: hypothetical protein HYY14_03275 [Candidatus Omnitrophica bacterium]|nr:hypothetical protein [Candidatus Omnitrophota bacterium]